MSFDFDRLSNELAAESVGLADAADMIERDGEPELAAVVRNASAVLSAAWEQVEAKRLIVAHREQEEDDAIRAVLRDGETIESFVAEVARVEVARRQRQGAEVETSG